MLVALGALLAFICVIIFARTFWEMALTVMRWRKRNQVPAKVMNLEADLGQLRAENAMMAAKLESTSNDLRDRLATQIAETSRLRNRTMELANEIATKDREIADRDTALQRMSAKLAELQGATKSETKSEVTKVEPEPETSNPESAVQKILAEVQAFATDDRNTSIEPAGHRKIVTLKRAGGLSAITRRLKAMQSGSQEPL
jgi:chromosome segregation ATPase